MEQKWFNSMLFNRDLEYRCGLSKSMDSFGPIENNGLNEDPSILTDGLNEDPSILTDMDNNIPSWKKNSENSSYSHGDYLVDVTNIQNFLSDKTFLVRDGNRNSYSIDFSFENQIFDIHNKHFFGNAPETVFDNSKNSSSLTNVSKSNDHNCTDNTKSNWNNKINHCIESYLCSQICIDSSILDDSDKYNSHEFNKYIGDILDMGQKSRQQPHIKNEQAKTDPNGTDSYDNDCNKFSVPTDKIKGRDSTRSGNYRDSNSTKIENSNHSDFRKIENSIDSAMDSTGSDTDSNTTATDSTVCRDRATAMDSIVRNIGSNGTEEEVDIMSKYAHLWVQCESCFGLNYKKFLKSKMNICEHCGDHLKMSSSDRIELSIDPGTWNPMDEDMVSLDPVEWDLEDSELNGKLILEDWTLEEFNEFFKDDEELQLDKELNEELNEEDDDYINRLDSYQDTTGLLEAIQTGTGQLNGIPVAIGIMDFQFMGGSMGSVVGEKITRLIEYATNQLLPLIIVCASGGARMQEGSLSLMQMGKISCALYNYQINKNLFYVTILTSPTTGGVTASFGMLGDIIIAEPKAYLAFAGKRVIEELLKTEVPEGSQSTEVFFEKGLVDLILSRDELKEVLTELLEFHGFFPLTENEN